MADQFIDYLTIKKKSYAQIFEEINSDEYLNKYKSKFLKLKLTSDDTMQKRISHSNEDTITTIKESFQKLAQDMNDFRKQTLNLLTRKIRIRYAHLLENFMDDIFHFNENNTLYYGYVLYEYQSMPHLFPKMPYYLNTRNKLTSNNVVMEIMIDASVAEKFTNGIIELLQMVIQNNILEGGNFCFYFFFAPWEEKFKPILELLFSHFEEIEIYYPLCMLTYSNRVIYFCKKKYTNAHSNHFYVEKYDNLITFSKKIAYYALYTFALMRYIMIAEINNSPIFDVMINKIMTHFNNVAVETSE